MKEIKKLGSILFEIECDEYLNEETLPKIREARGLVNMLYDKLALIEDSKLYSQKELDEAKEIAFDKGKYEGLHSDSDRF